MRLKATRKWPIDKSDEVLLYWMEMLTRSHPGQAKQNKTTTTTTTTTTTASTKQPMLLPSQQMPATAQNLTSTTPITPRNSCIYFKPNNPRRPTVSLAASPPSSFLVT